MRYKFYVIFAVLLVASAFSRAAQKPLKADPYLGAIVVNAENGKVLFEDKADVKGYPASVVKLMTFLVLQEKIEQGIVKLDAAVKITREAAAIGGRQVWLAENEVFSIEELLYAMLIHSANDAATALAIHVAGSKDAFAQLMNKKARELGMRDTAFHNVHGLPPGMGQEPDVTTARDLATLALAVLKHPDIFKYCATKTRPFREPKPVEMSNPNSLLYSYEGCDGLKTGYYSAAGFSIAATAKRKGQRLVAVVLGSTSKKARNAKAAELLSQGFLQLPARE